MCTVQARNLILPLFATGLYNQLQRSPTCSIKLPAVQWPPLLPPRFRRRPSRRQPELASRMEQYVFIFVCLSRVSQLCLSHEVLSELLFFLARYLGSLWGPVVSTHAA